MSLDRKDIAIIEQLEEDGRMSMREMAENIDLSPSTVSNRFRKLRDDGIVRGFGPKLDYERMGFDLTALVDLTTEPGNDVNRVAEGLKGRNCVRSIYVVTGETDIVLVCKFLGREDMYGFLKRLQKEKGVKETTTKAVLDSPEEEKVIGFQKLEGE